MTRLTRALMLMLAVALPAAANPYLRPIDLSRPHFIAGGYLDVEEVGSSEGGTAVALLTHSTEDGCGLPSIVCTDWTPLAVGGLFNGGSIKVAVGPVFNVAPIAKSLLLKGLQAVTAEGSFGNLKQSLGSVALSGNDVTVSMGPAWVLAPQDNFKGYFRVFVGGELRFGAKQ
ncbi:MAG: hypothetical protein KGZ65_04405 [Sphingomonadales bacterium]|nr:hypothetical protein [Sphingomonadaceae bacterium]MBS3930456.1 hypothetical protein [Sphingomonadales bacterium]